MRKLIGNILQSIMLWCGSKLFNVVLVHAPDDQVTAVHFAESVRDLNISVREYVEYLDQNDYSPNKTITND
jgi:hypothetical protein